LQSDRAGFITCSFLYFIKMPIYNVFLGNECFKYLDTIVLPRPKNDGRTKQENETELRGLNNTFQVRCLTDPAHKP